MPVQQDKAQEDLEQCWLGDAAQKKVQVGGCVMTSSTVTWAQRQSEHR